MSDFALWREKRIAELQAGPQADIPAAVAPARRVRRRVRGLKQLAGPLVVTAEGSPREALLFASAPRFDPKWVVTDDGCWEWTGSINCGYGEFRVGGSGGKIERAHRVSYELRVGPIPEGLTIDHLCCNKACVNPAHLEPVTMLVNARRYWVKRKAA